MRISDTETPRPKGSCECGSKEDIRIDDQGSAHIPQASGIDLAWDLLDKAAMEAL